MIEIPETLQPPGSRRDPWDPPRCLLYQERVITSATYPFAPSLCRLRRPTRTSVIEDGLIIAPPSLAAQRPTPRNLPWLRPHPSPTTSLQAGGWASKLIIWEQRFIPGAGPRSSTFCQQILLPPAAQTQLIDCRLDRGGIQPRRQTSPQDNPE